MVIYLNVSTFTVHRDKSTLQIRSAVLCSIILIMLSLLIALYNDSISTPPPSNMKDTSVLVERGYTVYFIESSLLHLPKLIFKKLISIAGCCCFFNVKICLLDAEQQQKPRCPFSR